MGQTFSSGTTQNHSPNPLHLRIEGDSRIVPQKLNPKTTKKNTKRAVSAESSRLYEVHKVRPLSTLELIQIDANVSINDKLLVAKCFNSNFIELPRFFHFTDSLTRMIMGETVTGRSIFSTFGINAFALCRFLKILVTDDEKYYLMPLIQSSQENANWVESSFDIDTIKSNPIYLQVLIELLSMIKRQKKLISENGFLVFIVELFLNRRGSKGSQDPFHMDIDVFGHETVEYVSVTNISQRGYGFSAEIKHDASDESYTLMTKPSDTIILHNKGAGIVHRSPVVGQINRARYTKPERGIAHHQTNLTNQDFTSEIVKKINVDTLNNDPRTLIRMAIYDPFKHIALSEDYLEDYLKDLDQVTHLVPTNLIDFPLVKYSFTAFDREPNRNDYEAALTSLKRHSIGGKSKKKKRKRKEKRTKKRTRKYVQRGGVRLPEYFAIYAEESIAQLICDNVEVSIHL